MIWKSNKCLIRKNQKGVSMKDIYIIFGDVEQSCNKIADNLRSVQDILIDIYGIGGTCENIKEISNLIYGCFSELGKIEGCVECMKEKIE